MCVQLPPYGETESEMSGVLVSDEDALETAAIIYKLRFQFDNTDDNNTPMHFKV